MTYAWLDLGNGRQVYRRVPGPAPARSHLPSPMIIGDAMDPVEHPCDGRFYDSKSGFRAVTRANDCIEIGNDPARFRRKPRVRPDRKGIREAIQRAANRIKNG
jgi:hypothetical protein